MTNIARVFYRAGYIESWGRGIQKICDACKNLGADEPVYIVHGKDIMVKFHALQSSKVPDSKMPNRHNDDINVDLDVGLEKKILIIMEEDSSVTMGAISDKLNVTKRTVERIVKKLREQGKIERIGGKRYGHWVIHE